VRGVWPASEKIGFKVLGAIVIGDMARRTFRLNHPGGPDEKVMVHDILSVWDTPADVGEAHINLRVGQDLAVIGVDARGLQALGGRQRRQHGRQPPGQQRLAGPRAAAEQDVVDSFRHVTSPRLSARPLQVLGGYQQAVRLGPTGTRRRFA
jgi:hypothetical protein